MSTIERIVSVTALILLTVIIIFFSYFMVFSGKTGTGFSINQIFSRTGADEKAYMRIKISFEMADYDKTQGRIEDFLADYPDSKYKNKVLVIAATIFYNRKNFETAKNYVERAISNVDKDNSDYVDSITILGKIALEMEIFDPIANNYLEDAYMKADLSKKSELAVYLGYQNFYKKDYDSALRFFNSAVGEFSIMGRARVYIEQGKYPEAIQEYLNFFNTYPKGEHYESVKNTYLKQTLFYASQLKQAKINEKAIEYLTMLVELFPRENEADEALIQIAEINQQAKNYTQALSYLNKALANSVTNGDDYALYDKALVYYDMTNKLESYKTLQTLLDKYPNGLYSKKAAEWAAVLSKDLQY